MGAEEKDLGKKITQAAALLSDKKREYIIGYAEGVIAMADAVRAARATQDSA